VIFVLARQIERRINEGGIDMKKLITIIILILWFSFPARAQQPDEYGTQHHVTFGYTTQTSDFGPNGFEVGFEYRIRDFLAAVGEGSFVWQKTRVNDVRTTLSPTGFTDVNVNNNAQNYQFGPRFFFPKAFRKPKVVPFAHLLFGVSRNSSDFALSQSDESLGASTDTAWSWSLGGGVDYWFKKNWAARGKIDLLKTHFGGEGQAQARITVAIAYDFSFKR
jgi:outer membrane protein with beta-barrel domain